jgi:hypothetical protein
LKNSLLPTIRPTVTGFLKARIGSSHRTDDPAVRDFVF